MEVGKVAIIVVDMEVGNVADEVAAIVVKIPNEDFTDSGDGDTFEDNVRVNYKGFFGTWRGVLFCVSKLRGVLFCQ